MMKQLDKIGDTMGKIGDKLANVVEGFPKETIIQKQQK